MKYTITKETIKGLAKALLMRREYTTCQICEAIIGDGFDHNRSCELYKYDTELLDYMRSRGEV